jgi:hypothetical protein
MLVSSQSQRTTPSFSGWKRHIFCAILNIHKPGIYLSQAMKLAYQLPAWADSFYNAPGSVIEAFFVLP